ncbi:Hpt domain-containing protein [Silicimonas algicola]|uniref:Hpt domain-containing protein n=1 Tax=Silicimonas algicola TaxID=1826607 RepID=A0A316G2Z5_9RHOB|nr:Hpt domain-containing protein [Silicimonas algicola]PWK54983.1 Hpt domain-containing protein [Silicimonas algicola]
MDKRTEARLAAVRARFAVRLEEGVARLETYRRALSKGDPAPLGDLESFAHNLAGAAASFDFPEVGDAALTLEDHIQDFRSGNARLEQLERPIASLQSTLRGAVSGGQR